MQELVQETTIDMARVIVKLENLSEDFKEIKEALKEVVRHTDMAKQAERIADLEKRVESLTTWRNMILGGFAVVSVLFTIALAAA